LHPRVISEELFVSYASADILQYDGLSSLHIIGEFFIFFIFRSHTKLYDFSILSQNLCNFHTTIVLKSFYFSITTASTGKICMIFCAEISFLQAYLCISLPTSSRSPVTIEPLFKSFFSVHFSKAAETHFTVESFGIFFKPNTQMHVQSFKTL
jgi:hypothetical protein